MTYAYLPRCFVALDALGRFHAWCLRRLMASGATRASLGGFRVLPISRLSRAIPSPAGTLMSVPRRTIFADAFPSALSKRPHIRHWNCSPFLLSLSVCEHTWHSWLVPCGFTSMMRMPIRSATIRTFRNISPCRMYRSSRFRPRLPAFPARVIASRRKSSMHIVSTPWHISLARSHSA